MPDTLEPRDRLTLKLLIKYIGLSHKTHYRNLRSQKFPEELAAALQSNSEYLDSLASRQFQQLEKKGWIRLDGTGLIEILHEI